MTAARKPDVGAVRGKTEYLNLAKLRALDVDPDCAGLRVFNEVEQQRLHDSMTRDGYDRDLQIEIDADTGKIVGGRNRRDAAVVLGLKDVPVVSVKFASREAKLAYIRRRDLDRRHLTPKELKDAAVKLVLVDGISVREAAKQTGVSKTTVAREADKARSTVLFGTVAKERTIGADGKSRPATRPKKPKSEPKPAKPKAEPKPKPPKAKAETKPERMASANLLREAIELALNDWYAMLRGCVVIGPGGERVKVKGVGFDAHSLRPFVEGTDGDGETRKLFAISEVVSMPAESHPFGGEHLPLLSAAATKLGEEPTDGEATA